MSPRVHGGRLDLSTGINPGPFPAPEFATEGQVAVHPNNPTGAFWPGTRDTDLLIIDESFCDVAPDQSLINLVNDGRTIILKSFGKFWKLAGLRLGFAIGDLALIRQVRDWLGPWPVFGPALAIVAAALSDNNWANQTRTHLKRAHGTAGGAMPLGASVVPASP